MNMADEIDLSARTRAELAESQILSELTIGREGVMHLAEFMTAEQWRVLGYPTALDWWNEKIAVPMSGVDSGRLAMILAMKDAGMSVRQTARAIEVSPSVVSRDRTGKDSHVSRKRSVAPKSTPVRDAEQMAQHPVVPGEVVQEPVIQAQVPEVDKPIEPVVSTEVALSQPGPVRDVEAYPGELAGLRGETAELQRILASTFKQLSTPEPFEYAGIMWVPDAPETEMTAESLCAHQWYEEQGCCGLCGWTG
jgi:hypothetical protein